MKKFLLVFLIVIIVLGLFIGGLVFALSPPFPVIAPQKSDYAELEPAFKAFLMERVAVAFDDYTGKGDMEIVLDEAGFSQVLADTFANQMKDLPKVVSYTGIFMDIRPEHIQIGSGFKFLAFPVGVSARMKAEVLDGILILTITSAHLGRIPLPLNLALKIAGKYGDLPEEVTALSVSVPLNMDEESPRINFSGLELQAKQIVFSILAEENPIDPIDEEVLADLEEVRPQAELILKDNPPALEILEEIEFLIEDAKAQGKKVYPLKVGILGERLYNSLSQEEIQELSDIIDDDTMEFLQENMDWYSPLP